MAKLGCSKPAGSGRQKGTKNNATLSVEERLAAMNCKPLEGLAEIAKQAKAKGDLNLATTCYKELCKYVHPQRKAVEHTGSIDGNHVAKVVYEIIDGNKT